MGVGVPRGVVLKESSPRYPNSPRSVFGLTDFRIRVRVRGPGFRVQSLRITVRGQIRSVKPGITHRL